MSKKLAHWTRLAVFVVTVAGTQTGCKSGWKMPGSDLFSWSKKPTESTLAGSSPSLSMPSSSTSPTSPATKSAPSPLGSTAQRNTTPYGSTNGPSFSMPSNNSVAMGGAGTAASQNGYTNGPYGMVSNNARPGGYTAPTAGGVTPPSGFGPPAGFGAPAGYGTPAPSLASNTAPTGPKPSGYAPTNTYAGSPNLPAAYGGAPTAQPGTMPSMPNSFPSMPGNTVPAMPASYNGGPAMAQSLPPIQSSMPNAAPGGGYPPSMPSVATQSYNGAAPYRPGSVARPTGYDFSSPTSAGATPSGYALPPAVPATASGAPTSTYR